jgi:alkaline phosphatase
MLRSCRCVLATLVALLGLGASAAAAAVPGEARPRSVILMIPDGCGPAAVTLARLAAGRPLSLDSILVGMVETYSADSHVTDSAASATAYATGFKTDNRMLAVDPEGRPLGTLLEAAETAGLATGLVTTAPLTDATPAAFAAHVAQRTMEDEIALELLDHHVDVLLGGGWRHWRPEAVGGRRQDGRDLFVELRERGRPVTTTRAELAAQHAVPLLGLFGERQIDLEADRDTSLEPSLDEMAAKALELLGGGRRGFFLMIEGGRIDDAAHDDDPAALAREVLAFDRVVARVLAFARRDGRALVVACADHETGGLGLGLRTAHASPYAVFPESLANARESLLRMSDSILAGGDPVEVAKRGTGVSEISREEQAGLRGAAAAPDSLARDELLQALSAIESRRARVGWSTGGHTGVDVGLYAFGPGREGFIGLHENTEVSRLIAGLLGLDLRAETVRLRQEAKAAPAH